MTETTRLHRTRHPTYSEIAAELLVRRCRGITTTGHRCLEGNHETGFVTFDSTSFEVHWADRRPSQRGIFRFLHLVAYGQNAQLTPVWVRYYRTLRAIRPLAEQIRVSLPASLWDGDKEALLPIVRKEQPSRIRTEALRWLRQ